jgi:hypothetical protein
MENITIKQGRIQWPIQKGVDESITIEKEDGWEMYEEILSEVKSTPKLTIKPLLRLTLEDGIVIKGTDLTLTISRAKSRNWADAKLYTDIKLKLAGKVLPSIFIDIILSNTSSDLI